MTGRMSVYAEGKSRKLGQYVYDAAPAEAGHGKHDHVVMETDAPARIVFTDHRRFGLMTLVATDKLEQDPLFKGIGIEPLSDGFDAAYFDRVLKGKKTPIKSALLDQRVVAGVGNIYACEALFRAHISPKRKAATIPGKRSQAARRRDPDRAEGSDQSRRLKPARLRPRRRRLGRIPASLRRLRPRRRALPWQRLQRHHQAHRAGGAIDVLLSKLSTVSAAAAQLAPGQGYLSQFADAVVVDHVR